MAIVDRYVFTPEYRKRSLKALQTALETAPVYSDWRVFDPGPGAAIDERYASLPELTKKAMREHFPQGLVPNNLNVEDGLARDEIEYTFTSGTTEEKVINLWNQEWWYASEAASWKLNSHTARLQYPQKEAKLASALNIGIHCEEDLPMEYRIMGHRLFLNEKISLIQWQPRHLERMAHELETYKPVILEANPSLLVRLAWWALDNGRQLFSPSVIVFTYELPSKIHMAAIRQAFSSPLVSSYGSTETGFVLMQCEDGLFHQNTEFCRIDFEPLAERHGGPELGRILVTTFNNPWASVVRFDMGDLVRLHRTGQCTCGRNEGFLMEAIEGRLAYATFTTDGDLVTPLALDSRLAVVPGIRDYRVEQRQRAEYELELVVKGDPDEAVHEARLALEALYGTDGQYSVKVVPSIQPGPSGKFRRSHASFDFDKKGLFA